MASSTIKDPFNAVKSASVTPTEIAAGAIARFTAAEAVGRPMAGYAVNGVAGASVAITAAGDGVLVVKNNSNSSITPTAVIIYYL